MRSPGLSAIAVGTTSAGALLVWSGLRGASVLSTVQDVVKGEKPKGALVYPIDTPTGATGGGAGGIGGSGAAGGAGAMVALAKTQVGTRESGRNVQKYSKDLGYPYDAWCADFILWLAKNTGNKALIPVSRSAPGMAQAFGSAFVSGSAGIKAGDIVFHSGASNGWHNIGHVGIAITDAGPNWQDVEGNYGDKVALVPRSSCQGHARPNYAA